MHPLHACAWSVEQIRVQGKIKLALFQQMIEDFSGQSDVIKRMFLADNYHGITALILKEYWEKMGLLFWHFGPFESL